jgi:dihydrofolate synthase/folylpolyglutamate synthase
MLATIAQTSGLRTGLYTSPHLHTYRERIQINGEPISRGHLAALLTEFQPVVESIEGLTTFEVTTALAFLHFAREKIDLGVMEVGLGGRLDATNVITPEISVIASLSLDHTSILGNTLAEIAGEKGGIIKPGVPCGERRRSSRRRGPCWKASLPSGARRSPASGATGRGRRSRAA